jgi:hypothetical protein
MGLVKSGITPEESETFGEILGIGQCKKYEGMCRKWKEMRAYGVAK